MENNQLYYRKDGANLIALTESEEQKQAFKVCKTVAFLIIKPVYIEMDSCISTFLGIIYAAIAHC